MSACATYIDARFKIRLICFLFFFSGVPALIYQLVWQRALFRILGVNIESVTIVITAFMLGLGLGSLTGGYLSKKIGLPLLPIFAAIEILTGLFGIFSLTIFDLIGKLVLGQPLFIIAFVTLTLVLIPTLLMGATLPILVTHLSKHESRIGQLVGTLYSANTFGAGVACFFAAFILFPFLGMHHSIYAAVILNLIVAACSLALYRDRPSLFELAPQQNRTTSPLTPSSFRPLLISAALSGFISLSIEIFLFRIINYATGSSPSAFALTLGIFLFGIAYGSIKAGEVCAKEPLHSIATKMMWSATCGTITLFIFIPFLSHAAWLRQELFIVLTLVTFVLAASWGAQLPALAHLAIQPDERTGIRTAQMYLANILGAAAGSILTGFVFMNIWGIAKLSAILAVFGAAYIAWLCLILPVNFKMKLMGTLIPLFCGALLCLMNPSPGYDALAAISLTMPLHLPFSNVSETRSGIITVDQDGVILGNGMYEGYFNTDLLHHDVNAIVRPFALSLFHPSPHNVLMIGLASGSWANVIASNPEVRSLTVVEINPGYLQLIQSRKEVASILSNPKIHINIDDGRRWLEVHPDQRFDAIIANTSHYFRANATNLLSTEFLRLIQAHLNDGGIYFFNTTDSPRSLRTACLAFPYGWRMMNHIVVSQNPILLDYPRWRKNIESTYIGGVPVVNSHDDKDAQALDAIIASFQPNERPGLESCSSLLQRTQNLAPYTDDNMGSEWRHNFIFDE